MFRPVRHPRDSATRPIRTSVVKSAVRGYSCESLEQRMMLTVSWVNKGVSSGDDNDRFDLVFGSQAAAARAVVEAAIDYWERSLTSFNYGDGGNNIYEMKIQMNEVPQPAGSGVAANAGFNAQRNGKPSKGSMGIAWLFGVAPGTNSAAGYFLDPTPYESSEFQGTWSNGFVRQNTNPLGGADLLTLAMHEMGHAFGLAATAQTNAQSVDTESSDTVNTPASTPPSTLWLYDNGNGSLWTEWDSGGASGTPVNGAGPQHFAPVGTSAVRLGVTYSGAVALMNALFTSRSIISDIEMDAAARAYGYTVTPPSRFGTTYGQLDADGTLRIDTTFLGTSNDVIGLSASGGVLSLTLDTGAPVAGIDPTGQVLSTFSLFDVDLIELETGAGADIITIGAGVPTTRIFGGSPVAGAPPETDRLTINGATGTNSLNAGAFTGGSHNITNVTGIEDLTINGTTGNENFFINNRSFVDDITSLLINGFAGGDNCTVNQGELDRATQAITNFVFNGNEGNDVLTLNNSTELIGNWNYGVTNSYIEAIAAGYYFLANYTSCSSLTVHGTPQSDTFVLPATLSPTASLNGNDGSDNVILGAGNLTGVQPQFFNGGNGVDQITFDNHLDNTDRIWDIRNNEVFFGGLITLGTAGFESVDILGGSGRDEFAFQGFLNQAFNIDGGGHTDSFILGFNGSVYFNNSVTLLGGTGGDVFTVNDAAVSAFTTPVVMDGGADFNFMDVKEPLVTDYVLGPGYFIPVGQGGGTFVFANMLTTVFTGNTAHNNFTLYSAGVDFIGTFTIHGGVGNDTFLLVPQPGGYTYKGLTLNGNEGTDTVHLNATALSTDENYTVGTNIIQIARGVSTETITSSSMNQITLSAGSGNDLIAMNQYSAGTPVTINGGGGDDVCNVGNGDVAANITSIASFLFNGMEGTDTFNLRNANPNNSFTYAIPGNTTLQVSRTSPSYFVSLEYYNTEQKHVYAGPAVDTMNITSFASGELSFHGAGGDDAVNLPTSSDLLGRRFNFYGDAGTANRINQLTNSKTAASTLHVAQNTIRAFPDDTFFAPGGSVFFDSVQIIRLTMGSGSDTAYLQPDAVAAITVFGANPPNGPGVRDKVNLALAAAENYAVNGNASNGNVTSTNLKTLAYSEFESGPAIDDVAPLALIAAASAQAQAQAVDSVNISFGEPVVGLDLSDFTLTRDGGPNLLTGGESLSTSDNAAWTLSGLAALTAISGTYTLTLAAAGSGISDTFGNALVADASTSWEVALPSWLAPDSLAIWDPMSSVLTVTGLTTIVGDPGVDVPTINANGETAIIVIDPVSDLQIHAGALNLSNGATAVLVFLEGARTAANHRVLVVNALSIDSVSTLDLTDNDLLIDYDSENPAEGVEVMARTGYNGGDWLGTGITSSTAANDANFHVGVADNATLAEPFGSQGTGVLFAGFDPDLTSVLVKFTHRADINLDGLVNFSDASVFGTNYQEDAAANWSTGDIDFDGLFTFSDAAIFGTYYDENLPLL